MSKVRNPHLTKGRAELRRGKVSTSVSRPAAFELALFTSKALSPVEQTVCEGQPCQPQAPAGLEASPGSISSLFLPGRIFTKVVLEAPLITESALEVIRKYCEDEVRTA